MPTNRRFKLAQRPVGMVRREDFTFEQGPVPEPQDGRFLVRTEYISLDPAMRVWMNEGKSFVPPAGIGEVMRAGAVGRIVASQHPQFAAGQCALTAPAERCSLRPHYHVPKQGDSRADELGLEQKARVGAGAVHGGRAQRLRR
jgi:NADPH-dependent curcumin reductase CurA